MPAFKGSIAIFILLISGICSSKAQRELFERGDAFYASHLYKDAIIAYEKALAADPKQPKAIVRLAESYLMTNDLKKAEEWYAKAIKYSSTQEYMFEYAKTLKANGRIDAAQHWFDRYAQIKPDVGTHFANSCDFVRKQEIAQNRYEVKMLPDLNTKNAEFAPIIQNNKLVFASSRSVAVQKDGEVTWTNDAFNQHYQADLDAKTLMPQAASPLRHSIGKDINDAPMSYAQRGELVAITSNNFMDGIRHVEGSGLMMDIYLYKTKAFNDWDHSSEEFFTFNAGVDADKPFSTGHPALAPDGSALYFCSNRPGGFGGYDIYVSYRTKGGWTKPKNLGENINTPGNEMSPYIDGSGRLFFSSDWHHGFGGMDIFTAVRLRNGIDWGIVENLGRPVNSPYDDMYFVFDNSQKAGFFSSNRPGGQGHEDIYYARLLHRFTPPPVADLKAGDKVILVDIYQPNQVTLDGVYDRQLNNMVKQLKNNQRLVIHIFSHTDSRGSAASNLELSEKRAKAAKEFFLKNGITSNRVRYKGLGEEFPVNKCKDGVTCTDEQYRENRRTEIYVIGHLDKFGKFIQEYQPKWAEVAVDLPANKTVGSNNSNANRSNPTPVTRKTPPPAPVVVAKKPVRKSHYAIGDVIEVAKVNYEFNKATVDKNSPGLKELLDILQEQKHVILEVGSHTDANGSDSYNLNLSQKRAEAVKNYLISKGIAASRLQAKGYGETKLLNRCKNGVPCSRAEHAVNRRTEFKVIGHTGFKYGDIIKVDNINYATGSAKLDMRDMRGLNEIVKILKENKISVEVRSHTDSHGDAQKNLQLSEERAKAVYDYLVKNGVNKFRLKYKGYGETLLLNGCKDGVPCSSAQHAANRRTDFKVIGLK